MGRDETGIDHAARRIDDRFVRASGVKAPISVMRLSAMRIAPFARIASPGRPVKMPSAPCDQHHVSAPTSLSCHCPSASLDSTIMSVNRPTPASVMRNSAANMRGMSSWKPDCRIS